MAEDPSTSSGQDLLAIGLRSAAGGRNEETYSKYAAGIRIKQSPSRRQHKPFDKLRVGREHRDI